MEETKENELQCKYRVTKNISEFRNKNKLSFALKFVNDELEKAQFPFLFVEKARLLRSLGKVEEALGILNDRLAEDNTDYTTHKERAIILAYDYLGNNNVKEYLQEAVDSINLARKFFDETYKTFKEEIAPIVNAGIRVTDYMTELIDLRNTETNIKQLQSTVFIFTEINEAKNIVKHTEDRILSDRIRTVEILGLFVGIFAFIITSTQIAINYPMVEAIAIILAMGLILLVFLFSLHLAFNKYERNWLYISLIIFFLIVAMFFVPLLPDMIKGLKFKFGIL